MRTTLVLDSDIYEVAVSRAKIHRQSLGKAVSEMARASLGRVGLESDERGFPVLVAPPTAGTITSAQVREMITGGEDDEAVRTARR